MNALFTYPTIDFSDVIEILYGKLRLILLSVTLIHNKPLFP